MKKEAKSLNEFWSALISAAIGGYLGTYIANLLNLHWILLGLLVAIIFLISYKLFLILFKKI
ncbi:MAG: hypothetical protein CIT03_03340 [Methanobacterium sp.]|nr:MAG: hypothetical protein CIT03_03340 [Methanobacterium sp.]